MKLWILAFLSQNISKLGTGFVNCFSVGHRCFEQCFWSTTHFNYIFLTFGMIHCSSIGFRKKNDCLLLLMGSILTLTMPSCFLLSFYFISALHSTKQHLWILINTMSVLLDTRDHQKLFWICCQFLGKRSFCKEKHQENIEHIVLINTKNNNLSLHPRKNCQKCHCVMSATIKRKSTLTTSAFKNWTEHSVQHCHICEGI